MVFDFTKLYRKFFTLSIFAQNKGVYIFQKCSKKIPFTCYWKKKTPLHLLTLKNKFFYWLFSDFNIHFIRIASIVHFSNFNSIYYIDTKKLICEKTWSFECELRKKNISNLSQWHNIRQIYKKNWLKNRPNFCCGNTSKMSHCTYSILSVLFISYMFQLGYCCFALDWISNGPHTQTSNFKWLVCVCVCYRVKWWDRIQSIGIYVHIFAHSAVCAAQCSNFQDVKYYNVLTTYIYQSWTV